MTDSSRFLILLLAMAMLFGFGCGQFTDVQFKGVKDIHVNSFNEKGLDAEISITINNPNGAAFTIFPSSLDLMLMKTKAGKAHLTNKIKIKPRCQNDYTLHLVADISYLNVADLTKLSLLALTNQLSIGLKGNLTAGKFFIRKKIPVDFTQNISKEMLGR